MEYRPDLRTKNRIIDPLHETIRLGVARERILHGQAIRWAFAGLVRFSVRSLQLRRTRDRLARLDQRQLRDIGVGMTDARKESQKPFWRV